MRHIYLAITGAAALAVLGPVAAHAQDGGYTADNSRIMRGGNGPRMAEPIARKKFDQAVEKVFRAGDTNRDGTITLAEFNAAIEARKAAVIAQRFAAIDTDRNRQISLEEFTAWQHSLGSVILADSGAGALAQGGLVAESLPLELGSGRDAEVFRDIIAPLSATLIVEANTNYDGGVSLDELLAYEGALFEKADLNKDGWLVPDEIISLQEREGKRDTRGPGPAPAEGRGPGGPGGPPPPPPGD